MTILVMIAFLGACTSASTKEEAEETETVEETTAIETVEEEVEVAVDTTEVMADSVASEGEVATETEVVE